MENTTFEPLCKEFQLKSEKIIYSEENHRPKWLNIIIGDIKNNITGIYHGVTKRDLLLFLNEQEWRFNHRYNDSNILNKIRNCIFKARQCPKKTIITVLNISKPYFSTCV